MKKSVGLAAEEMMQNATHDFTISRLRGETFNFTSKCLCDAVNSFILRLFNGVILTEEVLWR
jgi:hypothetical protein